MPFVSNPTAQDLFCAAAREIIPARGAVEVAEEVAALVPLHIFVVGPEPVQPEPVDPASEAAVEAASDAENPTPIEAAEPAEGASN